MNPRYVVLALVVLMFWWTFYFSHATNDANAVQNLREELAASRREIANIQNEMKAKDQQAQDNLRLYEREKAERVQELDKHASCTQQKQDLKAEELAFGLMTSAKTFEQRVGEFFPLWSPDVRTESVFFYSDAAVAAHVQPQPRISVPNSSRFLVLVKDLYNSVPATTKWFLVGDDDTIWFVAPLLAALSRFDPTRPILLGCHSDKLENLSYWGFMAYGGGGVILSRALVQQMVDRGAVDECYKRFDKYHGGDEKISRCVNGLGIDTVILPGLRQMDFNDGTVTGPLENMNFPLLSIHHLNDFHPLFQGESIVSASQRFFRAYRSFPTTFLAKVLAHDVPRSVTYRMSVGFIFKIFNNFPPLFELMRTEKTWGNRAKDWPFAIRPQFAPCEFVEFQWTSTTPDLVQEYVRVGNGCPHLKGGPLANLVKGIERVRVTRTTHACYAPSGELLLGGITSTVPSLSYTGAQGDVAEFSWLDCPGRRFGEEFLPFP